MKTPSYRFHMPYSSTIEVPHRVEVGRLLACQALQLIQLSIYFAICLIRERGEKRCRQLDNVCLFHPVSVLIWDIDMIYWIYDILYILDLQ